MSDPSDRIDHILITVNRDDGSYMLADALFSRVLERVTMVEITSYLTRREAQIRHSEPPARP